MLHFKLLLKALLRQLGNFIYSAQYNEDAKLKFKTQ